MTCGEGADDDRRIWRYRNHELVGKPLPCPDHTGSHLSFADGKLLLGQWYNKLLLLLDGDGAVTRRYDTPHEVCGIAVVGEIAHVLGTDDENHGAYYITGIELGTGAHHDLAIVPFRARGLAWDGKRFWTNHREANRTVTFQL